MARTFTSTGRLALGSFAPPVAMSMLCWSKAPNTATLARYFQNDTDTWFAQNSSTALRFHRDWGGGSGIWDISAAAHGMTLTNWNHLAITYDGGSTANDPLFYANGVSKTVTRTTAPAGTIWTTAGNWFIGNNTASGTLPHGGSLAFFSFHNVVLTQAEILEHMLTGFTGRGRMFDIEVSGDSPERDRSGNGRTGTVTGTTVAADNPPVSLLFMSEDDWMEEIVAAAPPATTTYRRTLLGVGV